ncbi:MAG: lytic transglycosylase domain-containing protein [Pseudomonadota bacterium]
MIARFLGVALAACLAAPVVVAEEVSSPPPFKDFTFKRVKPPAAGTNRRITVQIAPAGAAPAPLAAAAAVAPAPRASDAYPWFWEKLSPRAEEAGAGRLFDALDAIAASGAAPTPRLQALQSIAKAHRSDLLLSTVGTRVSPALVLAVISVESSGNPEAVSRAGAQGLMQLMPETAARFGVGDAMDPSQNIAGGVALLDHLMERYGEDPLLVLAAYNAGEGAVRDHGGVPPYPETRNYIPKVLAAFTVARGLCLTPPLTMTDGCVFAEAGG